MTKAELYQKACMLPLLPGVYIIRDKTDTIIYIGKAKRLRIRVSQYFREGVPHDNKVSQMIAHAYAFDVIVCQSEFEALVLEASQIKAHTPKYNILLKDDKSYPHLMLNLHDEYPALRKFRGNRSGQCRYFGPYASATAVNEVMDVIQKIFMLRSCRDNVFHNRERPCLLYQIKRCSGPCVGKISQEDYAQLVKEVIAF